MNRRMLIAAFLLLAVAVAAWTLRPVWRRQCAEEAADGPTAPALPCVQRDPLTGLGLPGEAGVQYYSVIIENARRSRPQHGLAQASVVYEMLAEGGVTRFLAIFGGHVEGKIGPVRSARPYIIDRAFEHEVMIAYCGGSPEALDMMARTRWPGVDEIRNPSVFERDRERKAPHNLFTTSERLLAYAARRGMDLTKPRSGMVFNDKAVRSADPAVRSITIDYWPDYKVQWKYDPASNRYLRYMAGPAHTDPSTGRHIAADNVIIQFTRTRVLDSEGRLSMLQEGQGDMVAYVGGTKAVGRWVRPDGQPTVYVLLDGIPMELNAGITWVQVVPVNAGIKEE